MSNGAEVLADALMDTLLSGESFALPNVNLNDPAFNFPSMAGNPLYAQVTELTNEDLTTRTVGGSGTYDAIMKSQAVHLKEEFTAGRITGADYAKAYVALAQSASGQAVQFLLGKDQAYWASVIAQGQALTARVQLETAKAQLAIALIEANNQRATFALNKIRLANEDAQYGITKYNLTTTLPAETAQTTAQTSNLTAEGLNIPKQGVILTNQAAQIAQQTVNLVSEELGIDARTAQTLKQTSVVDQEILIKQQQALIAAQELLIAQAKLANIPKEGLQLTAQTSLTTQQTSNLAAEGLNIIKQGTLLDAQELSVEKNTEIAAYNLSTKLPAEVLMITAQKLGVEKSTESATYTLTNILPKQADLVLEQTQVQRAQTLDTRSDLTPVTGSVKAQKDLYAQQIESYQRSSQLNAAKVFVDAFTAESALNDGGGTSPAAIAAGNVQTVLSKLQSANNL